MSATIAYLPFVTTIVSAAFFVVLLKHYRRKPARYLWWWTFGVAMYGAGTFMESLDTVMGFQPLVFRGWYIFGAVLGGVPLAQGTVHLMLKPNRARVLDFILIPVILSASVAILASPLREGASELSGHTLVWEWIRTFPPFINTYALIFLVGGAGWSAWTYWRKTNVMGARVLGNILIAIGGLLPGIGGAIARNGAVDALFITELIGLFFIWGGYWIMTRDDAVSIHATQRKEAALAAG